MDAADHSVGDRAALLLGGLLGLGHHAVDPPGDDRQLLHRRLIITSV